MGRREYNGSPKVSTSPPHENFIIQEKKRNFAHVLEEGKLKTLLHILSNRSCFVFANVNLFLVKNYTICQL